MSERFKECPDELTLCHLEVLLMPNGEVICLGNTVGWFNVLQKYLIPIQEAPHAQ